MTGNRKRRTAANYVRSWREHRGLTQNQLAERIGMTHSQISRVESGNQQYTQKTLEKFARVLDCTVTDLLARPPEPKVAIGAENEREWKIGMLSTDTAFRLLVSGPFGVREIERLIKLLEFDKESLGNTL
jgi:transcriptional regulator with XRE-family HTH domain